MSTSCSNAWSKSTVKWYDCLTNNKTVFQLGTVDQLWCVSVRWWGGNGINWTMYKSFASHSRQITMPVPYHSVFTGQMPFLSPNQQCGSAEGNSTVVFVNFVLLMYVVAGCWLQLSGASAIIHFTTAVCHCGWSRTTAVHCASRNGLSSELENNLLRQTWYCISRHLCSRCMNYLSMRDVAYAMYDHTMMQNTI